jgi:hypothetical protein
MKICFSRKGSDSQYGGLPSPILPDGRLVPLPIPTAHDHFTLEDLNLPGVPVGEIVSDLSQGRLGPGTVVHLDPDLDRAKRYRKAKWRPALGQTGGAQSHLARQGFGDGDVFLFFGWFRQVEQVSGRWRYARGAPNLHVIFGWLEVDLVLPVVSRRAECLRRHPWIENHPHVANPEHYGSHLNHLYVARSESKYARESPFGAGRFTHYRRCLQLTAEGRSRSVWRLPNFFMPSAGKPALSCHSNSHRWSIDADGVLLKSVAKGQEFVLDSEYYSDAEAWLKKLVKAAA